MLYIEQKGIEGPTYEEQIVDELEAYAPMLPRGNNLSMRSYFLLIFVRQLRSVLCSLSAYSFPLCFDLYTLNSCDAHV